MGDRGNIKVNDIYLYSHWNGSELGNILKDALIRGKERWHDAPYLTRIIFSEMIKDEVMDETGYGISTQICDNEHEILVVDTEKQTVSAGRLGVWTFEEFCKPENKYNEDEVEGEQE